jgi:two-component system response regulator MtrA
MKTGIRILVVEDDPAVGDALLVGIGQEGYSVHLATTVTETLKRVRQDPPDLMVLDLRLPDGSGFDVCRAVRQAGLRLPILMLTVQSDEVDKVVGLEVGADDYVTKPYRLRELLARIHALLRRAYGELSSANAQISYAGDLVIDRTSGQVTRAGKRLNLTPTEFKLLAFLAERPGQVFSRGQLIENVWGYSAELLDEKTVNVHIRRLRQKIELDPADPRILLTVSGLGYRVSV